MSRRTVLVCVVVATSFLGLGCPPETPSNADGSTPRDAATTDTVAQDGLTLDAAAVDGALSDAGSADRATTDAAGTDGAAADVVVGDGGSCTGAEQCPSGQGCYQGHCGTCHGGADCRVSLREGCVGGVCGPCTGAVQCDDGLGCRTTTGECNSCRVAQECRSGEGCVDGVCDACMAAADCSGGLCTTSSLCTACVPGTDDQACRDAYGDSALACQSDGTCAPTTCTAGTDCQLVKLVCSTAGRCETCDQAPDCLDSLHGGYAAGTLCVSGRCVEANCLDSTGCPADRPVCGSDSRCRSCQSTAECLARAGVASGYVCDVDTGRCEAGNCFPNAEPCSSPSNGVCEDYTCRACANDALATLDDCQVNGYPSSVLCVSGSCVLAQCNDVVECALGRVCDQAACVDCTTGDDSYCTGQGMTCNTSSQSCVGCTNDNQCAGGQRICDTFECRDCLAGECGTGRVCAGGACVDGACWIDGLVLDEGDTKANDVCSRCTRLTTPFAWSPNPGQGCNDNLACTQGDTCSATVPGVCAGASYTCTGNSCANGVCHGTGPGDCTLEEKTSWTGCFLDGICYLHGDPNPANPCQYCDGTLDAWVDKTVGTRCGTCRTCQRPASAIQCSFVASGQDPHDDCPSDCQVCDDFGGCRWADASTDPNSDCTWTPVSGCLTTGECVGGSTTCAFWTGGTGQVDDGKECTINDHCDGAGQKTGDAVTDGTLCASGTKICRSGDCTPCLNTPECGIGKVCSAGGLCVTGNCNLPEDCGTAPTCQKWTCPSHACVLADDDAASCSDDDPCTLGDHCLSGDCQPGPGTPNCTSLDDACNDGLCVKLTSTTYECHADPKPLGTSCNDDGLACTVDRCDGGSGSNPGQCLFSSVAAGQCYINGNCRAEGFTNPAIECEHCDPDLRPLGWSPKAPSEPCTADTLSCTADLCTGGSTCGHDWDSSTASCLEAGACTSQGADRPSNFCEVCSGSNTWDPKTDGTPCNDGDASTQHDICYDRTCQDRFYGWSQCLAVGGGYTCVFDRMNGALYYVPATCTTFRTWAQAYSYCQGLTTLFHSNFRLPTLTELQALATATASTGCSGSPYIDSDIAKQVTATHAYWTHTCNGLCPAPPEVPTQVYTVRYNAASPTVALSNTTSTLPATICVAP
ncbi:MAG: hypothetical protein ABIJ09_09520 [Pseudomonadota bacterium]